MIYPGDKIVVGLSGGADSVCLLFLLRQLSKPMGFSLQALHINHKLRPEADEEAAFVKKLCLEWEIPCAVREVDVKKKAQEAHLCIEEAARLLRYREFEAYKDCKVALAHHQDDQAETVLFHLFRGTGIRGLTGMRPVRERFIRPLLCAGKAEIIELVKENRLPYVTDESNFDTAYARNKIRHDLLPMAEREICEKSTAHIAKSAELLSDAADFLEQEVMQKYQALVMQTENGLYIEKEALRALHPYLQSALIYEMLAEVCGKKRDIAKVHVDSVLDLAKNQSGKRLTLIYGLCAGTDQRKLYIFDKDGNTAEGTDTQTCEVIQENKLEIFERNSGSLCFYQQTEKGQTERIIKWRVFPYQKEQPICHKTYTKWFDYDKINNCPVLRVRKSGDFFYCSDTARKKLKEYFINERISVLERDRILLLADESHIMWVLGGRISSFYKVSEHTKKVLEITIPGGEENE